MTTMGSTVEGARVAAGARSCRNLGVAVTFSAKPSTAPCPICGGKDRFRFDDKRGEGTYYCGQCGAGTGIILLRKLHGWDHKTACGHVDEIIGRDGPRRRRRRHDHIDRMTPKARPRSSACLAGTSDDSLVEDYLRSRGLSVTSAGSVWS